MTNKMMTEYDNTTKETTTREMTNQEQAQHEAILESSRQKLEQVASDAAAKTTAQTKLAALGLTADDLKALGL
jgi:hypothetical protein